MSPVGLYIGTPRGKQKKETARVVKFILLTSDVVVAYGFDGIIADQGV